MKIYLYNRDGAKLFLVSDINEDDKKEKTWKFYVDKQHEYIFESMGVIYDTIENPNKRIVAIDPSGGPYLYVGLVLEDKYWIKEIKWNGNEFVIITEDR